MISLHTQSLSRKHSRDDPGNYRIYENEFLKRMCVRMLVETEYYKVSNTDEKPKLSILSGRKASVLKHTVDEYVDALCNDYTGNIKFNIYTALVGLCTNSSVKKDGALMDYFLISKSDNTAKSVNGNQNVDSYSAFAGKFIREIKTSIKVSDGNRVYTEFENKVDSEGNKSPVRILENNLPETINIDYIEKVWMAIVRYLDILSDVIIKMEKKSVKEGDKSSVILGLLGYVLLSKPNRIYDGYEHKYGGFYRPIYKEATDKGLELISYDDFKPNNRIGKVYTFFHGDRNNTEALKILNRILKSEKYFQTNEGHYTEPIVDMVRYIVADEFDDMSKRSHADYLLIHSSREIIRDFYILLTAKERLTLLNRIDDTLFYNQAIGIIFGKEEDCRTDLPEPDNIAKVITDDKFNRYFLYDDSGVNESERFDEWLEGNFETTNDGYVRSAFVKSEYKLDYGADNNVKELVENYRALEMLKFLSSQILLQNSPEKVKVFKDTYNKQYKYLKQLQRKYSLSEAMGNNTTLANSLSGVIKRLDDGSTVQYSSLNNFLYFCPFTGKMPESKEILRRGKSLDSGELMTKIDNLVSTLGGFLKSESRWIDVLRRGSKRLEQFCRWCVRETMTQYVDELRSLTNMLNWNIDIDFDKLNNMYLAFDKDSELSGTEIRTLQLKYGDISMRGSKKSEAGGIRVNFAIKSTRPGTVHDTMHGQEIKTFKCAKFLNDINRLGESDFSGPSSSTVGINQYSDPEKNHVVFFVAAIPTKSINNGKNIGEHLNVIVYPNSTNSSIELWVPIVMDDCFSDNKEPINRDIYNMIHKNKENAAVNIGNNAMLIGVCKL